MPNPAYVGSNGFSEGPVTVTSAQVAFSPSNTAQNTAVVMVVINSASASPHVTSVSDTNLNTYQQIAALALPSGFQSMYVFAALNIKAGANTFKANFNQNCNFVAIIVGEYGPAGTCSAIDISAGTTGTGTALNSGAVTPYTANELLVSFGTTNAGTTIAATGSWTKRQTSGFQDGLADQLSVTGAYSGTWTGTSGQWGCVVLALGPNLPVTKEVIFTGTQIGTAGSFGGNGNVLANLFDANETTLWNSPDASGDWAGLNVGALTYLTRIHLGLQAGFQYRFNGAQIQGNATDVTFASNNRTMLTGTSPALNYGLLNNEFIITPGNQNQYFRILCATNFGNFADLDFIGQYQAGVSAMCCTPVITPPGGAYDYPVVVTLASITSDAAFFYTTDGTTPTISSAPYSGPFAMSNGTLKVLATSANVSNSRIASAVFNVPSSITPTFQLNDVNRGLQLFASNGGCLFTDPASKHWFLYGQDYDGQLLNNNSYTAGYKCVNIYQSDDIRNWLFANAIDVPASDGTLQFQERWHVTYNALNNNYVTWRKSANPANDYQVWTASNPLGPFTFFATYTALNSITTGGDLFVFLDPTDGVSAYLYFIDGTELKWSVQKLNANYTNVTTVHTEVTMNGTWGANYEAPCVMKRGNTYFMLMSHQTIWAANENDYFTASSPMGPFALVGNPFQNVSVPTSSGGIVPTNLNAYDTQNIEIVRIPGRDDGSGLGAWVYMGDRYDAGGAGVSNFQNWRCIMLPVTFPTAATMQITWSSSWTIDGAFANTGGTPLAPRSLSISFRSMFFWANEEPNPVSLYLDSCPSPSFISGVQSEVITFTGVPPPSSYTPLIPVAINTWYRIRAVNVSGTSVSQAISESPLSVPVTVGTNGYYIALSIYSVYHVGYLLAGIDYSWLLQSVTSGPYPDTWTAQTALLELLEFSD